MKLPPSELITRSMVRPMKFFSRSPIIIAAALYVSVVHGILYLMFTTIPNVFQDIYHFELQYTGLAYLGLGVGMFLILGLIVKYDDRTVQHLRKKNGGDFEPEMRLATTIYFAPFIPIALLGIFVPCQTYAVDAFPETVALAVAALVIMRSAFGAFLPFVGPMVYAKLGLGGGNSLLGGLALLVTPVPYPFLKWSGWVRRRWVVRS